MDYSYFSTYCFNQAGLMAYMKCEIYRKKVAGKKKPREWFKELGGAAP